MAIAQCTKALVKGTDSVLCSHRPAGSDAFESDMWLCIAEQRHDMRMSMLVCTAQVPTAVGNVLNSKYKSLTEDNYKVYSAHFYAVLPYITLLGQNVYQKCQVFDHMSMYIHLQPVFKFYSFSFYSPRHLSLDASVNGC